MASMVVANSSTQVSSTVTTVQEKGSRNKRKFRADPPPLSGVDLGKITTLPPSYEFSADKFETAPCHSQSNLCDLCNDNSNSLITNTSTSAHIDQLDIDDEESREANWSDLTESQLEELVLSNLDAIFRSAIKKLVALGFPEEYATRAVLRSGICYGTKDAATNVVENALASLRNGLGGGGEEDEEEEEEEEEDEEDEEEEEEVLYPEREHRFEDLHQLERYVLAELVCFLREVRPFYSTGDAMWSLLICDMNVSQACSSDGGDPTSSSFLPETSEASPIEAPKPKETEKKLFAAASEEKLGSSRRAHHSHHHHHQHHHHHHRQKPLHSDKPFRSHSSKNPKAIPPKTKDTDTLSPVLKTMPDPNAHLPVLDAAQVKKTLEVNTQLPPVLGPVAARLGRRVRELEVQAGEWTEWANQKVMQAARRLGKEREELRLLRREREEAERLRKERAAAEEGAEKKLVEMRGALGRAKGQENRAEAAARRLELENERLRREAVAAAGRAEEAAQGLTEAVGRERRAAEELRSWEKRKRFLEEELASGRRKAAVLVEELEQCKAVHQEFEAKLHQEDKATKDLLSQIDSLRKEREQIESSTKSKEEMVKQKAEANLQKYKDDIRELEKEISQLRLKTDSPKIAALRRGVKLAYSRREAQDQKPVPASLRGVRRERECVMCLSEEMSVVFLPCAHQVVCTECNELHEKQGMKECPSCRTLIQRRISVRYARST